MTAVETELRDQVIQICEENNLPGIALEDCKIVVRTKSGAEHVVIPCSPDNMPMELLGGALYEYRDKKLPRNEIVIPYSEIESISWNT